MTARQPPLARLEVLHPGVGNTIQDLGRPGFRHQGVPLAGALDADLARCAQALVHNPPGYACIEMRALGPSLRCAAGPVLVSLTGEVHARITRNGGVVQHMDAWCSATLFPGDELHVSAVADGCAYLAVQGELDVPEFMGSHACFGRWNVPGLLSRPLAPGDVLDTLPVATHPPASATPPTAGRENAAHHAGISPGPLRGPPFRALERTASLTIRAMAGPQIGHLSAQSQSAFWAMTWHASAAQDRMGLRLQGDALQHTSPAHREIVSDPVTPGTIQVPADGQPIALLADCQTMGGYPKVAVVISADLPLLAHCPAGKAIQFVAVTLDEAHAAMRARAQEWRAWATHLRPHAQVGWIDANALQMHNLISGAIDARDI